MKIKEYFDKPYPYDHHPGLQFKQALGFGTFVFLFLWFFAPFGLQSLPSGLAVVSLLFGAITALAMMLLNVILPLWLTRLFDPENWTLGKEFFWTLVNVSLIGLGNFLYFSYQFSSGFSLERILWFQVVTLGVSIFPIGFMVIRKEAVANRRYVAESLLLNEEIKRRRVDSHKEKIPLSLITLIGQNGQDKVEFEPDKLLVIEAADNYISLYLEGDPAPQKQLFRQTMQEAERVLSEHPQFYRCHRSYLVNLDKVTGMHGNAQGYKLEVDGLGKDIPVSRKQNEAIRELLTIHP